MLPALNSVMMKSSMLRANASRAPAITPGIRIGSVTRRNVVNGSAPRSFAASSSERSYAAIRAWTVIAT